MDKKIVHGKDNYIIQSELKRTAWYTTSLALAQSTGQYFTVITASDTLFDDTKRILARAARILGKVDSSHVIKAYDVDLEGDNLFVVLENIEGLPVPDWLKSGETIEEFTSLRLLRQLALALKDLEYYHVTHGNIKPSSLVIAPDSSSKGEKLIKIWDLVLSEVLNETIHFQSPEKVREETTDIRSDIYSVGAVIYWMLTGKTPYDASNVGRLALQISSRDPQVTHTPLAGRRPDLSKYTVALIERCMMKNSDDRFRTAGDLVNDVEKALGSQTDTAGFLVHQAQVSMEREDWPEVLRIAERAEEIPGPKQRLRLFVQKALKRMEEATLQDASASIARIENWMQLGNLVSAAEEIAAWQKALVNHQYLHGKLKLELIERYRQLEETLAMRKRFKPAYLESLSTAQKYPLDAMRVAIGRTVQAQGLQIDMVNLVTEPEAKTVSRHEHAWLVFDEGVWRVQHKESKNITLYNGSKLGPEEEQALNDADVLQFGLVKMRFCLRNKLAQGNY